SDLALDVMPSGVEGFELPVHWVCGVALGTPILDNCDLEKVSEEANAPQALGIPADRCTARRGRRHRVTGEPAGYVLEPRNPKETRKPGIRNLVLSLSSCFPHSPIFGFLVD